MKQKRSIIQIDESLCNGCGQCVPACAEGAIQIIDGKARLVADKHCDGLGACLGECPTGALKIVERDAEEFVGPVDEQPPAVTPVPVHTPHMCPSARVATFQTKRPVPDDAPGAGLNHWPVQIRLIPPHAPFLQNAHLLVTADCVPVAYPGFHRDLASGKVVMVGCPKFDDTDLYLERFADIFRVAEIQSVTIVVMEVPCCQGLPTIVQRAMQLAGKTIPLEKVVITLDGQILDRQRLVA